MGCNIAENLGSPQIWRGPEDWGIFGFFVGFPEAEQVIREENGRKIKISRISPIGKRLQSEH